MRAVLILLGALLLATRAAAQQGSLQVSASAQAITAESPRLNFTPAASMARCGI